MNSSNDPAARQGTGPTEGRPDHVVRWQDHNREELAALLPEAVVVLPVGATEQHGPHLATATDALLARTVATAGIAEATERGCSRPLVLAPTLPFGASDHHLPFGGTLSLTAETLLAVLLDIARSVARSGGRRLVLVNGHGGNRGICSAAAAAAATRHPDLAVAYLDYWTLLTEDRADVPGHAGAFETSLALAVDPGLVTDRAARSSVPRAPAVDGVEIASLAQWLHIDGYTDNPERATVEDGRRMLDALSDALAGRLIELADRMLPESPRPAGF